MSETLTAPETVYQEQALQIAPASAAPGGYNLAIGYLRAFITLLVLAHHAVLAYHPAAPPPPASLLVEPRWWQAFPVVDSARWSGFALFVGFNDTFFMSLMFFLSGLFVWRSLKRKGGAHFLRDRFLRLGLPFAVAAAFIAPLAYYPAYLQSGAAFGGFAGFWREWLALGNWPAGPAWFVWLLLAFDFAAAALFGLAPRWGETLGRLLSGVSRRPAVFFALLVAISAAVYIPLALIFNPFQWTAFGPFTFQTSRLLHYFVYFLAGIVLGACGIERGLLAPDGKLARRWPLWMIGSLVAFGLALVVFLAAISAKSAPQFWGTVGGVTFALSCAASSFFFLAIFARFAKTSTRVFDSLRDNAYGMYLIHYAFVSWLQLALLRAPLSGLTKGILVTLGTVLLSWGAVAALRRIPRVAQVI
jgi:peptidoglycan/LPS O-acetylase OafA/YrhL